MDLTLIEAAKNNCTSDLGAKLGSLTRDDLEVLLRVANEHHSEEFEQEVIRAMANLAGTENPNQNPDIGSPDENELAGNEDNTNRIPEIAPTNPDETNNNTGNAREVGNHLNTTEGGRHEDQADPNPTMDENIHIAKIAALVGFSGLTAAALFAALSTLKDQDAGRSEMLRLRVEDILQPNKWPAHFYLIISLTVGFTVSLVVAVVSIWGLVITRPFCYVAFMFVAVGAFFFGYGLLLKDKVPNFSLGIIPGYWVVWLFGSLVVFWAVAIFCMILVAKRRIVSAYRQ